MSSTPTAWQLVLLAMGTQLFTFGAGLLPMTVTSNMKYLLPAGLRESAASLNTLVFACSAFAPVFGVWVDRLGDFYKPMLACMALEALGIVVELLATAFPETVPLPVYVFGLCAHWAGGFSIGALGYGVFGAYSYLMPGRAGLVSSFLVLAQSIGMMVVMGYEGAQPHEPASVVFLVVHLGMMLANLTLFASVPRGLFTPKSYLPSSATKEPNSATPAALLTSAAYRPFLFALFAQVCYQSQNYMDGNIVSFYLEDWTVLGEDYATFYYAIVGGCAFLFVFIAVHIGMLVDSAGLYTIGIGCAIFVVVSNLAIVFSKSAWLIGTALGSQSFAIQTLQVTSIPLAARTLPSLQAVGRDYTTMVFCGFIPCAALNYLIPAVLTAFAATGEVVSEGRERFGYLGYYILLASAAVLQLGIVCFYLLVYRNQTRLALTADLY